MERGIREEKTLIFAKKFLDKLAKAFARYRGHLGTSGQKLQIEFENEFSGLSP